MGEGLFKKVFVYGSHLLNQLLWFKSQSSCRASSVLAGAWVSFCMLLSSMWSSRPEQQVTLFSFLGRSIVTSMWLSVSCSLVLLSSWNQVTESSPFWDSSVFITLSGWQGFDVELQSSFLWLRDVFCQSIPGL